MFAVHVARQGAAPGAGGRNARELGGAGVQTPLTVGVWDLQGVIGRSEGVQASRWRGSGSLGTRWLTVSLGRGVTVHLLNHGPVVTSVAVEAKIVGPRNRRRNRDAREPPRRRNGLV